jgi:hypothetical protein
VKYKTKWNSLSDFKNFLEKETKEEVISFNGYALITSKAVYGLVFGQLIVSEKRKENETV